MIEYVFPQEGDDSSLLFLAIAAAALNVAVIVLWLWIVNTFLH
ncbi:hypothetical protein BN2475_450063 [Paraburkholderia ribeironis]|uniref:Uncharacterized protein n=1 Tax=Paraburkholderia ribeironis TaxID=1247936 RepID=A0A1N7S8T6_9BURK|nr:hypothetical protein BN2475_450063 [Paraburkholderia ribeironis]